ncbi:uncharacterized protein LOC119105504 [Pollicipes pollicipes]|uniref:uncharacterized protein LOC119105504 n=1 Tax=Pollicipes pollicipes TaxID=41117 RepID=UPI0018856E2B|nr:uncharacterized protein LOC119105504 [Pollicipes pollicipes]
MAFPACPAGTVCPTGNRFLKKLAWNRLEDGASMAHKALIDFHLTQRQYEDLLRLQVTRPDLKYSEVACDWMRRNAEVISRQWLMHGRRKNEILIGGIFPISGSHYRDRGIIPAVMMAIRAINSNTSILQDYKLTLMSSDGQCSSDMVMKSFINYLRMPSFAQMVGILGPACSNTLEPIAGVSRHFRVLVISYSAEGVLLTNRSQYPYFFRTIGENKQFRFVYKQLLAQLKWKRVASLTENGQKYSEYISIMHDMLQASGVTFIANRKFPSDTTNMATYLKELKDKKARIIIADMYQVAAKAIMCEAYLQNMTARQGYIWFLPEWFWRGWYNTTANSTTTSCTSTQLMEALDGHLALAHAYFPSNESSLMQEGISVRQWREYYKGNCSKHPVKESDYASYAYDATWVFGLALHKLLKDEPSRYQNFRSDGTNERLVDIISATDFDGVSGHLRFVGPSRVSITEVKQWRGGRYHVVGRFLPEPNSTEGGKLVLDTSKIQWLTADGLRPDDGSSPPCDLQPLADLLGTDCQTAVIIVILIVLLIVIVSLVVCLLFYKRRYEGKMLQLGLDLANAAEWEVKRENIVMNRKLGEGAFGTVYGGDALLVKDRAARVAARRHPTDLPEEWCSVAVKTLKLNSTLEEKLDFLSEAEVMKQFNHTNIVQLLGVCTLSEPILTVMEFMLYGDLKTFLLSRRSLVSEKSFKDECNEISDKKLTSMARDVACALSYLAERKYVHRDVACRNCLVNTMHVVKLADFGMTRSMCENDYYKFHREGMLPVRWMAPESLADGIFTPKSDIWSFGVLLFEIATFGSFPFQGMSNGEVLEHVRAGNHVAVPPGVKTELAELLLSCWAVEPAWRPDAHQLVELLGLQYPRLVSPCLDAPHAAVQLDLLGGPHPPGAPSPNGCAGKYVVLDHRPSLTCAETTTI